jgi:hypothetical protein
MIDATKVVRRKERAETRLCVYRKPWLRLAASALAAGSVLVSELAAVEVRGQQPISIVDLRGLAENSGLGHPVITAVVQAQGRWAVAAYSSDVQKSVVISGGESGAPKSSAPIEGSAIELGFDSGVLYALSRAAKSADVVVFDKDLGILARTPSGLEKKVLERKVAGRSQFYLPFRHSIRQSPPEDRNQAFSYPQEEWLFPMPSLNGSPRRRWLHFGSLSEEIALVSEDGSILSQNYADLDSAYLSVGMKIPPHDPSSEVTRVTWAGLSDAGELYICLSSSPINAPAYIAVIEPETGKLARVIAAQMPRATDRVGKYNPLGFMLPLMGAVQNRLVVVDSGVGLLAIYEIK